MGLIPDSRFEMPELFEPGVKPFGDVEINSGAVIAPKYAWIGRNSIADNTDIVTSNITQFDPLSFNGSNSFAELLTTDVLGLLPFSVVMKVKADNFSAERAVVSFSDSTRTGEQHTIMLSTSGAVLVRTRRQGSSFDTATSSANMVAGEYAIVCGVWEAINDRKAYLNGVNKGSNTGGSSDLSGLDNAELGRLGDSSPSSYFAGDVESMFYYDFALSDSQVLQISQALYGDTDNPWLIPK